MMYEIACARCEERTLLLNVVNTIFSLRVPAFRDRSIAVHPRTFRSSQYQKAESTKKPQPKSGAAKFRAIHSLFCTLFALFRRRTRRTQTPAVRDEGAAVERGAMANANQ